MTEKTKRESGAVCVVCGELVPDCDVVIRNGETLCPPDAS